MMFIAFLVCMSIMSHALCVNPTTEELCTNIDQRLPCTVRELKTSATKGALFGNFIGDSTEEDIKAFYESSDSCPLYSDLYLKNPDFQRFIGEYMNAHAISFPDEHAELSAMAAAANIAPEIAFIQNACAELALLLGDVIPNMNDFTLLNPPPIFAPYLKYNFSHHGSYDRQQSSRSEHCSDLGLLRLIHSADGQNRIAAVQGHNEDWWSTVADKMSIVTTPEWFGYLYPGQLAGTSMVVNKHGLSLTMNSMYPNIPGYSSKSIPSNQGVAFVFAYVLRAIVNASSTEEVTSLLSKYPIYSGYSLNVMSGCDNTITNIEGYGNRLGISTRSGLDEGESVQGHFNSYVTLAVDQDPVSTSGERSRCQEKSSFTTATDVRNFLGNLTCPMFFTDINGGRYSETLATWIIDPDTRSCTRHRLPVDCKLASSRCVSENAQEPKVYSWDFTCPHKL